jgi:hypothetical protein
LSQTRGALEEAAGFFARAADLDPSSTARVDQAGVLVQLGRWPEAVGVLRRAFEERGVLLRVATVMGDTRFARLAAFEPYRLLVEHERLVQASALAGVMVTLNRIDDTSRRTQEVAGRIAAMLTFIWRISAAAAAPVVLLVLLGLLLSFGVRELHVFGPPWTLVVGMGAAAVLWYLGARVVTTDARGDLGTIGLALTAVGLPWAALSGVRWLVGRRRLVAGADPLGREQVSHTLALVDEAARLGVRWREGVGPQAEAARKELELALEALRNRLGRRSE